MKISKIARGRAMKPHDHAYVYVHDHTIYIHIVSLFIFLKKTRGDEQTAKS